MATAFLSTGITFIPSPLSSSASTSSFILKTQSSLVYPHNDNAKRLLVLSKAASESPQPSLVLTKRSLSISLVTSFVAFTLAGKGASNSNAAILEADDDEELMERVKKDRKKRLERQGVINSSNKETGFNSINISLKMQNLNGLVYFILF